MADEYLLRQAVDRAWTIYRAAHDDVHEVRMNAGACSSDICGRGGRRESTMPEELTCAGLAILERILSEVELDD